GHFRAAIFKAKIQLQGGLHMWILCLGPARLRPIRWLIGHLMLVALLLALFGVIGSPVPVLAQTADLQPAAHSKLTRNKASFAGPCGAKGPVAQRALFAAARPSVLAFALNLQPGKYETTSEISMPGPPVKPTPTPGTACITAKDVEG